MAWIALIIGLLLGAVIGMGAAGGLRRRWLTSGSRRRRTPLASVEHVVDLIRRAHHADAVCLCARDAEPVVATGSSPLKPEVAELAMSLAKLAMDDGREHVIRDDETVVAVGDRKRGVAVVLGSADNSQDQVQAIASELRRLLAEFQVDFDPRWSGGSTPPVDLPPELDTLTAIASGLCDRARTITGWPAAVVIRDPQTQVASVISVSNNADRRLIGVSVTPDSAAGRACMGDGAVAAGKSEDLFGREPTDRRRKTGAGTAYPLRDGHDGVGALVVFGSNEDLDPAVRERVMWLTVETGPRFATAAAVRAAEERADTDDLTGLPNRAGLEGVMAHAPHGPCAVLCVHLDDFKKIVDELGHAAGDAVLKHVVRVLRGAIRDIDVAARVGGEEFVVWLPETDSKAASMVAERIRRSLADLEWEWAGAGVTLTCSVGVSARPETTSDLPNLIPTADAALDRAKRAGRNRVEVATAEVKQSG